MFGKDCQDTNPICPLQLSQYVALGALQAGGWDWGPGSLFQVSEGDAVPAK